MRVYVNDKLCDFTGSPNIESLLESLGFSSRGGLAIAVNNSIVPRIEWSKYSVSDDDKVTVIQATQGG